MVDVEYRLQFAQPVIKGGGLAFRFLFDFVAIQACK